MEVGGVRNENAVSFWLCQSGTLALSKPLNLPSIRRQREIKKCLQRAMRYY
jgi:hypothetical protein